VQLLSRTALAATLIWTALACAATGLTASPAAAEALLLIEADSGKVLLAENATQPWYPASLTKLMTAYVTLREVKEGRISLDKPLTVSANALSQAPVKMGFPVGTVITVDNALKMMMVKSANDMAVVLAEGVGGSVEGFSDLMNQNAQRLGMTQTSYVNPNGLPNDDQIVSARDLAILARALIRDLPEYDDYWHLPGIRMGKSVQRNYNTLLGRYQGADGMKTGFICASGFNLVATATRNGRRLIAVVLWAPSAAGRAVKAAQMLERGFNTNGAMSWLAPSLGTVDALQPINAAPPNLREEMCGAHRKRPAAEDEDDGTTANVTPDSPYGTFLASLRAPKAKGAAASLPEVNLGEPVPVFTGAKPPPPGTVQLGWSERKPDKKKTAAAKSAKDNKSAKDKKDAAKGGKGAASAAASDTAAPSPASKPKPKKPAAPKPAPAAAATHTSSAQTTQAR